MKRIYMGLGILAILLAMAITFTLLMERIYQPMSNILQEAADASIRADWASAAQLYSMAQARWEQHKHFSAALADHSPMDDIDGLFGELELYLQQQEMPHFAATCRHLARLTEAMGENHSLNWWNFL